MDTGEARFGSDKTGLLCGYLFVPGCAGRAIDADEAADLLASRAAEPAGVIEPGGPIGSSDGFLWLHFNLANQASLRWLQHRLPLPEGFHTSLQHSSSTRVEVADEWLIALLNDVTVFGLDASTVSTMTLCVADRVVVSARHTPLRAVDRLRESVKMGECFRSPVELLAHLLRDQADVLVHIVRDATGQVDRLEDRMMANHIASTRPQLGSLRRMLVRLQRLLAPEPAALFRLLNRPPSWLRADDKQDLRESAEELAAALADSGALVERVRLLQEELLAVVNERTSKTLFVLTMVTVLALPMTIIPGLFGMNVGGVPFHETPAGFWLVAAFVIGVAIVAGVIIFRRIEDA